MTQLPTQKVIEEVSIPAARRAIVDLAATIGGAVDVLEKIAATMYDAREILPADFELRAVLLQVRAHELGALHHALQEMLAGWTDPKGTE